jgi:hypothetical protein
VESPGTAPGSEPLITGAFIAIVRVALDTCNIGVDDGLRKMRVVWPKLPVRLLCGVITPIDARITCFANRRPQGPEMEGKTTYAARMRNV